MFVAPNGTRMKGKVQAMAFLTNNGGSEEDKKLLAELNMLGKKATAKVKEGEEEITSNGKRAMFQPSSCQLASLLAAFADNSLPRTQPELIVAILLEFVSKKIGSSI